jgi:bacterioferritin
MIGHPRIIGYLQRAVNHELGAAQQYTLQAATAENWGLKPLADKLRLDAREELEHAEAFIAQMLRLGATPHAGQSRVPRVGRTQIEILQFGLATESDAMRLYGEASRYCASVGDADNHAVFARIYEDEARHAEALTRAIQALGGRGR